MGVSPEEYRNVARHFASGVTIVSVEDSGTLHGMTATSFSAVSLQPPLILVCLEKGSKTRTAAFEAGSFSVNILADTQEEVARAFSVAGPKDFSGIPHHRDGSGGVFLDHAIASIYCRTVSVTEAGDHDVFIGEVMGGATGPGDPLLYFDRAYRKLRK